MQGKQSTTKKSNDLVCILKLLFQMVVKLEAIWVLNVIIVVLK